jgi:hypothetical protein
MKAAELTTLGGVAARTPVLAVACSRCDRSARYRLDTLIARHGPAFGIPGVLRLLAEDCKKRAFVEAYDLCGVYCPDLPGFFLGKVEDQFTLPAPWNLFS